VPDSTRGPDLTEEEWQRLYRFRGYGNPAGRFWFIGIEERGDGTIEELRVRLKFREVEDLLYSQSPVVWGHSKLWKDFNPDKLIPTWSAMIRFVLRLSGDADWKDPERVRKYQKESLGKLDGQTFLTDILPLPKPSDASWPDFWPYRDWDAYADEVLPGRLKMFADLIANNTPEYVFCYGKGYWPHFKEFLPNATVKQLDGGRFEVAQSGATTLVLTPFFSPRTGMGAGRIESLSVSLLALRSKLNT
jgi:hypothetical protein